MKALITDGVHEVLIHDLKEAGYEVEYLPNITQSKVLSIIENFDVLVINSKIQVDKKFIDTAINLKCIGRLGSGLEIVDLEYAKEKEVTVLNSPEGNRDAVGEHAVGMLLSLFNKLNQSHQDFMDFSWDREARRGVELQSKTVGIIGYGNTGKAFAKKLSGFDVEVIFYDKYLKDASNEHATQVSLTQILQKSNIISLHLPYNKETHHFVNQDLMDQCVKSIYLINTSRGKVLDSSILLKNIENKKLLGVCLDVFENEKPETFTWQDKSYFSSLAATEKVLFSTHVAGWTVESKYKLAKILSKKILSFMSNK